MTDLFEQLVMGAATPAGLVLTILVGAAILLSVRTQRRRPAAAPPMDSARPPLQVETRAPEEARWRRAA